MSNIILKKTHFRLPYLWTNIDNTARKHLPQEDQISDRQQSGPWETFITQNPRRDFLGDLVASQLIPSTQRWSQPISDSIEQLSYLSKRNQLFRVCQHRMKEALQEGLLRLIPSGIAKHGGFLYYTDRLERCLVFKYEIPHESQKAAKVTGLVDIEDPTFLYDIGTAVTDATNEARSALKNALVFGHKIVAHHNTFVRSSVPAMVLSRIAGPPGRSGK